MRRRTTFIDPEGTQFNPDDLVVTQQGLSFAEVQLTREERITLGLKEVPDQVRQLLLQAQELHVRWAQEDSYSTISPFLSRLPSGLHVFYTPLDITHTHPGGEEDWLCSALHTYFSPSLKCKSTAKAFIQGGAAAGSTSAALQYYSLLPSLSNLVAHIQQAACSDSDAICLHSVSEINVADSLDIDYDGVSGTLTITAFWSKMPPVLEDPTGQYEWTPYDFWNVDIQHTGAANQRIEVGILNPSAAKDAHDLQLSGLLTRVGEDDHAKPTHFHFPSRHHGLLPASQAKAQQYTVAVTQPQGLHPTMEIEFAGGATALTPPENRPDGSECALHAYLTLPSTVFVDEYAFNKNDPLFGESHGIQATRAIAGETDLEAPEYVVDKWGSIVLLELRTNRSAEAVAPPPRVTIPLHLRYLPPSDNGTLSVDVPWPVVYWACTAEQDVNLAVNPFDRVNLGYDALHRPQTMFYHLDPKPAVGDRVVQPIKVPVYSLGSLDPALVEVGTMVAITVGFVWVAVLLWKGLRTHVKSALLGPEVGEKDKRQ